MDRKNAVPSQLSMRTGEDRWLALVVGNSRQHWALFTGEQILKVRHIPHSKSKGYLGKRLQGWMEWQHFFPTDLSAEVKNGQDMSYPELWLVSVVPLHTEFWTRYPRLNLLKLSDVPLKKTYTTLGLDRGITLWGAGTHYGWPCLVIDGGTALTATGADGQASLIGGSIMPGLGLQINALSSATNLPKIEIPDKLPLLWAKDTVTAIQSGVLNYAIAGLVHLISEWLQRYPDSQVVLTGGDSEPLLNGLQEWFSRTGFTDLPLSRIIADQNLIFIGIKALRQSKVCPPTS